ncbi:MAG: hypothetical protein LQ343_002249 [Gyalolechia ehrenbergii]|nr:MAG: hypothetical protein LQ343_002249 [Gyalolechia ehrenbergii]
MHFVGLAYILALVCPVTAAIAGSHGHGPRRRFNADESASSKDLALMTNAPGPPTIQPGIPSLQPSVPTSGVASLSIPPAHQTSSSRSVNKDTSSSTNLEISVSSMTVLAMSTPATAATTSIPYLSELMSQLFPQPSNSTGISTSVAKSGLISFSSRSSPAATPYTPKVITTQSATPPANVGDDPKDWPSTTTMGPTLVYSFQLPPYSGGLETSGVAENMPVPSPAEDNTYQPTATVYSYNLPPYTPKVPTYVATSAATAPVSMTSGAPGNPTANAPATNIFLSQGSVDPTKDLPPIATSTIIPLYSPACLGNAYGGGYVITPTISAANLNATGLAKIPPAYGFSYKLEPTQSPAYSAAVIITNTKASVPTGLPIPTATSTSSGNREPVTAGSLQLGVTTQIFSSSTNVPLATSQGLMALSQGTVFGMDSIITTSNPMPGALSSISTPISQPNAPPAASPSFNVPLDKLSSISSAPGIGFPSAGLLGSGPEAAGASSGTGQSIMTLGNSSCTTITTLATSSYLVNAAGSTIATLGQQVQTYRVAATFDSASAGTTNAASPERLRYELNSTLTLPGNGLEAPDFRGASPKLTSSGVGAFLASLGVCFAVGAM